MHRIHHTAPSGASGAIAAAPMLPAARKLQSALESSSLDPPSAPGFSGDPIPAGPFMDSTTMNGNPSAFPEPTTLLLALLGLVSLGCLAWRKRK